jgi:hypothetical protein
MSENNQSQIPSKKCFCRTLNDRGDALISRHWPWFAKHKWQVVWVVAAVGFLTIVVCEAISLKRWGALYFPWPCREGKLLFHVFR